MLSVRTVTVRTCLRTWGPTCGDPGQVNIIILPGIHKYQGTKKRSILNHQLPVCVCGVPQRSRGDMWRAMRGVCEGLCGGLWMVTWGSVKGYVGFCEGLCGVLWRAMRGSMMDHIRVCEEPCVDQWNTVSGSEKDYARVSERSCGCLWWTLGGFIKGHMGGPCSKFRLKN